MDCNVNLFNYIIFYIILAFRRPVHPTDDDVFEVG